MFVEWLAKRYKDAHVRAATILFTLAAPFEIAAPFMPSGELALLCVAVGGVCALASAVPQNAAIQRITPNEMRGRVTAIYLFMFIFFGALGGQLIGTVTQRVFGSDADLWKSIVLTASILLPLAAFRSRAASSPTDARSSGSSNSRRAEPSRELPRAAHDHRRGEDPRRSSAHAHRS